MSVGADFVKLGKNASGKFHRIRNDKRACGLLMADSWIVGKQETMFLVAK